MTDTYRLGLNARIYRNTGSYGSPAWVAMNNVTDVTMSGETDTADVSTRGTGGFKAKVPTLKDAGLEFEMIWDPSDPGFAAMLAAWLGNSSVDMVALDGPIATAGSQGLRANYTVTKFQRKEPLAEAIKASVNLSPAYSANVPVWYVAA